MRANRISRDHVYVPNIQEPRRHCFETAKLSICQPFATSLRLMHSVRSLSGSLAARALDLYQTLYAKRLESAKPLCCFSRTMYERRDIQASEAGTFNTSIVRRLNYDQRPTTSCLKHHVVAGLRELFNYLSSRTLVRILSSM